MWYYWIDHRVCSLCHYSEHPTCVSITGECNTPTTAKNVLPLHPSYGTQIILYAPILVGIVHGLNQITYLHLKQFCTPRCTLIDSVHRIFARTAARLSVFWNKARTSCLTSDPVNSCASGPLPSAHRSAMSCRPAFSISNSSLNLSHLATCLKSSGLPSGSPTGGWKQSGALSTTEDRRVWRREASSAEMSSSVVM